MPLNTEILLPVLATLAGLGVVASAAFVLGFATVRVFPWWPLRRHDDGSSIHCRYCYFGRAYVQDETARIEDDDLVEVTCYVCRSCSLPQWRVQRSPVLKRAA
jgi:hypothetical protein